MKIKVLASNSKGNCYALFAETETLIIECGISYRDILQGLNFDLSKVVGVLSSHFHFDHSKALKDFVKHGINAYASKETFDELGIEGYRAIVVEPERQFKVGNFNVLAFPVEHDAPGSMGFLIQCENLKLLFLTDTAYCQYNFLGVTDILIECNCSNKILMEKVEQGGMNITLVKRILKSHFSLENVIGFLKANDLSKVKNIVLIHLSDSNSNAKEFKAEVERETGKKVYGAEKDLEIEL